MSTAAHPVHPHRYGGGRARRVPPRLQHSLEGLCARRWGETGSGRADVDMPLGPSHSSSMVSVREAPVGQDVETIPTTSRFEDAQLLFEEARQRRRRRRTFVIGATVCGVLCLATTFFATGGSGHIFGGPPPPSGSGPPGGVAIQQSPSPNHGQQTPVPARPSVCSRGGTVLPRATKPTASLLPCYEIAPLPPAVSVHRVAP